jgi:hypothetical protein
LPFQGAFCLCQINRSMIAWITLSTHGRV